MMDKVNMIYLQAGIVIGQHKGKHHLYA